MNSQHHIQALSFRKWIWSTREHKLLLIGVGVVAFLLFSGYKYLYPYPNFLPDSYSYLEAAFNNQIINMWPIGYSKFLRLFSCFTHSHTILILFQYVLLQGSILYLLFTIAYLFTPGKWTLRILFFSSALNPLLLHVSNFISSDALFAALSLVWFTQLLWILYKPAANLLIAHAVILLLAFTVRYNALYYPFISLPIILFSRAHSRQKLSGVASIIILISAFVGQTMYQYRASTGTTQFSAFGGWQLASNALFAYAHVPEGDRGMPTERFSQLHRITNQHMDSLQQLTQRPDAKLGIYYLWDEQAPLKKYMHYKYRQDSTTNGFTRWAAMAPLYARYGNYLIKQYPEAFTKYYLWPNMVNYYVPGAEFLTTYNMGSDSVAPVATAWFKLKTNKVYSLRKEKNIIAVDYLPVLLAVINLVFVLSFIGFTFLGGFKKASLYFKQVLWWMLLTWCCNFGFSVLASPIVLRYQVFPMIITFAFLGMLLEYLVQESRPAKIKEVIYEDHHKASPVPVKLS